MKRFCTLLIGILVFGLLPAVGRMVPPEVQGASTGNSLPCTRMFQAQEIPDDGTWLSTCLLDPTAPEGSTVTAVHVKYLLEHPAPEQVEIRLRHAEVSLTIWDGRPLVGEEPGRATNLSAFNGTPSSGEWYVEVRDRTPGERGRLQEFTVVAEYACPFPLPQPIKGTPGHPGALRLPAGILPSTTPDRDEEKSGVDGTQMPPQPNGWQMIKREDFEGTFTNTGWVVLDAYPGDGRNTTGMRMTTGLMGTAGTIVPIRIPPSRSGPPGRPRADTTAMTQPLILTTALIWTPG